MLTEEETEFAKPPIKRKIITKAERGASSLPWKKELVEPKAGDRRVKTLGVKMTIVLPPPCGPGEIPFEEETEGGRPLSPKIVNGVKNGLNPSHEVFEGKVGEEAGEGEGHLKREALGGTAGYLTGKVVLIGRESLGLVQAR
jgi:hypothetical protein